MRKDPLLIQAIQLLSMRVGALDDIGALFSKTSCLNEEERTIIGYCEAFISMFGTDRAFSKTLKQKYIPALEMIGVAKWRRTELTHLGGRLANKETEDINLSDSDIPPEAVYAEPTETDTDISESEN